MITGGHTTETGAGIRNTGTLNLNGGNITGNYLRSSDAMPKWGAGIYNSGKLYINGGSITDNNTGDAVKVDGHYEGGAIYNAEGSIYFYDGTISGNHAGRGGGRFNYKGTVSIYGKFAAVTDNVAANHPDSSYSGTTRGGGLYNEQGTITISAGTISGNWANDGGGIYNADILTVTGGSFTGNSSTCGGAICNANASSRYGKATISNVTFTSNTASECGGAVYNSYEQNEMTIEDVTFLENRTTSTSLDYSNGGAIYNKGTMVITSENPADPTSLSSVNGCGRNSANNGGAIYNVGSLTITNWIARLNTAKKGGAIFNAGTLTVTGAYIDGNEAETAGGGIYLDQNVTFDGDIKVTNNKVNDADNNVYIVSDEKINIGNDLSADSSIGVTYGTDTGSGSYTFTQGYKKDTVENFASDSTFAVISVGNSGELAIHICQPNIIEGYDMTMAEDLTFRLTLTLGDSIDKDSAYVMVIGPNESQAVKVELDPDNTGKCVIPYTLYARQLNATISYALFDKDGLQQMSLNGAPIEVFSISAEQYLTALKTGDYPDAAKKVADAMLVYGTVSKAYLENTTESARVSAVDTAWKDLKCDHEIRTPNVYTGIKLDDFAPYKSGTKSNWGGSDYVGVRGEHKGLGYNIEYDSFSIIARDKVALRLYFRQDITNADFEIYRSGDIYRSVNPGAHGDITNYTVGKDHGLYYIEIPDIAAYDLGKMIYVDFLTYYNGGSASNPTYGSDKRHVAYEIAICPLSYSYNVMYYHQGLFKAFSEDYLSKALLRYYEDAAAYKAFIENN